MQGFEDSILEIQQLEEDEEEEDEESEQLQSVLAAALLVRAEVD